MKYKTRRTFTIKGVVIELVDVSELVNIECALDYDYVTGGHFFGWNEMEAHILYLLILWAWYIVSLLCTCIFITLANRSDLLSSNMAAQILVSDTTAAYQFKMKFDKAIQTLFWSYNCSIGAHRVTYQDLVNSHCLRKQLRHHIGTQ